MTNDVRWMIAGAAVAVLLPVAMLVPRLSTDTPAAQPAPDPVEWRTPARLSVALERPLFQAAASDFVPSDAPEMLGIVGRLGRDAVAMVRARDGAVRTVKPGEGVDGWQLRSLAIDAAYFTRGTQQARVPLGGDQ